jgi:hypothetical protein
MTRTRDPDSGAGVLAQRSSAVVDFTARRRQELRALLERGQARRELPADADLATFVDLVYGFLWYRLLVGHAPLDHRAAQDLTGAVLASAAPA